MDLTTALTVNVRLDKLKDARYHFFLTVSLQAKKCFYMASTYFTLSSLVNTVTILIPGGLGVYFFRDISVVAA